jgi:hypothetical protein
MAEAGNPFDETPAEDADEKESRRRPRDNTSDINWRWTTGMPEELQPLLTHFPHHTTDRAAVWCWVYGITKYELGLQLCNHSPVLGQLRDVCTRMVGWSSYDEIPVTTRDNVVRSHSTTLDLALEGFVSWNVYMGFRTDIYDRDAERVIPFLYSRYDLFNDQFAPRHAGDLYKVLDDDTIDAWRVTSLLLGYWDTKTKRLFAHNDENDARMARWASVRRRFYGFLAALHNRSREEREIAYKEQKEDGPRKKSSQSKDVDVLCVDKPSETELKELQEYGICTHSTALLWWNRSDGTRVMLPIIITDATRPSDPASVIMSYEVALTITTCSLKSEVGCATIPVFGDGITHRPSMPEYMWQIVESLEDRDDLGGIDDGGEVLRESFAMTFTEEDWAETFRNQHTLMYFTAHLGSDQSYKEILRRIVEKREHVDVYFIAKFVCEFSNDAETVLGFLEYGYKTLHKRRFLSILGDLCEGKKRRMAQLYLAYHPLSADYMIESVLFEKYESSAIVQTEESMRNQQLYYDAGWTPGMRSALYLAACIRAQEENRRRPVVMDVVEWLTDKKVTKSTVTGRTRPAAVARRTRPAVSGEVVILATKLVEAHPQRFPPIRFLVGAMNEAMNEKVCRDVPYTVTIESEWTFYSDVVDAYATKFLMDGSFGMIRNMMKRAAQLEETTLADMDCV